MEDLFNELTTTDINNNFRYLERMGAQVHHGQLDVSRMHDNRDTYIEFTKFANQVFEGEQR